MATFAQLRAKVTSKERELFDFLWAFFLRENKWPTHHDVYRDFMEKPELDKLLKISSGALVLREQDAFQLKLLGIWCTEKGDSFVEWTRKLIGYLRDRYYAKEKKDFLSNADIITATGLSEEQVMLLGRTLQNAGFFGVYAYFNPATPGWQISMPYQSLVDLPRTESIDEKFNCEVDRLAGQDVKVDHLERAQVYYKTQPRFPGFDDDEANEPDTRRRYQVFVSSTYDDLKPERNAVIQALLESDCIPVGMELFPAANSQQWPLIQKVIDESDYYVVIVAGRYGSIVPRGKTSYTEREFDYAKKRKIPILAFFHENPGSLPSNLCEDSKVRKLRLKTFLAKVKTNRLGKSWNSPASLANAVNIAVHQAIKNCPRPGWIRASQPVTFI